MSASRLGIAIALLVGGLQFLIGTASMSDLLLNVCACVRGHNMCAWVADARVASLRPPMHACFCSGVLRVPDLLASWQTCALEFVLHIDETFHLAFAPQRLRQLVTNLGGLAMPPPKKVYGVELGAVGVLVAVITLVCALIPTLIAPQVPENIDFMNLH